jgi:hypothetical protein
VIKSSGAYMQRKMPFTIMLKQNKLLDISELSPERLDAEIQKGFDDLHAGRVVSSQQLHEEMKNFNVI